MYIRTYVIVVATYVCSYVLFLYVVPRVPLYTWAKCTYGKSYILAQYRGMKISNIYIQGYREPTYNYLITGVPQIFAHILENVW